VQRSFFSKRSFAADGESTNLGETFAVLDIEIESVFDHLHPQEATSASEKNPQPEFTTLA
jgi:hypothetical protein